MILGLILGVASALSLVSYSMDYAPDTLTHISKTGLEKNWYKSAVFYHIYLRSFKDSNNDGIGDLPGLISKLDYLSDTLGIDAIWLSPIHPSPNSDFGYDVSDYYNIHPDFGTLEDFQKLLCECQKRNIKILLDLVVNHTSEKHPWFLESKKSIHNPKRNWYIWQSGPHHGQTPPNNWQARPAGGGSSWKYDALTDQWYLHSFLESQPDINWHNQEVKNEIKNIMKYWLNMGIGGFRLDIANYYLKDKLFRNNPSPLLKSLVCGACLGYEYQAQEHIYDKNSAELIDIFRMMRKIADTYNAVLIGEIDDEEGHLGNTFMSARAYGPKNDGLHMAFNFDLMNAVDDASRLHNTIKNWYAKLPKDAQPVCALSNHDKERLISRVGNNIHKAKLLALYQLSSNATPVIYYGDEIGMKHADINPRDQKDPLYAMSPSIIKFFMKNRDGARTPMQWDSAHNAGFSSEQSSLWLPINSDADFCNVQTQLKHDNSLLIFYKNLINLRKKHIALHAGKFSFLLDTTGSNMLIFQRYHEHDIFIIIMNFSENKQEIKLDKAYSSLISTHNKIYNNKTCIKLEAFEGIIIK
jgi:alpha-glucosidase